MKYVQVHVRGRVQGVGFRFFTQSTAMQHDISGWVMNQEDGSVLIEAIGKEEDMSTFLTKMKQGPSRFAKVQEIDITNLKGNPGFQSFEIRGY
ncbi:acylphosphatase [Gracilibacillus alcaliphilus]|uniref:acylphosphatase n=1 Tax=Gracilibacillus alcaliphilus TaxID=1401441 RepID=UPI0019591100|nr:acylphosphatase [Gracilibacillus alcaliphilus]MBM7675270.1 acylphosphatase [Gracilibacillus alcaliphilus]